MQKMIAAISYHKLKVSIRITFLDLTWDNSNIKNNFLFQTDTT